MIHINNLHKRFGDSHVLRGISCDIKPQEVVCIIGPSGSGKKHLPALHERPGDGRLKARWWLTALPPTTRTTDLNKMRKRRHGVPAL